VLPERWTSMTPSAILTGGELQIVVQGMDGAQIWYSSVDLDSSVRELETTERINTVQTNTDKLATDALTLRSRAPSRGESVLRVDADRRFYTFTANIHQLNPLFFV
jgi:hypothetical protein